MFGYKKPTELPSKEQALPGRDTPILTSGTHLILGTNMLPPFPKGMSQAVFGMGCFWGVERLFWEQPGVYTTAVGYSGGHTPNPKYEEVCSGYTGHNEVVLVVYDPNVIGYETLLKLFWENHNPTSGMQQGNDKGTQYRSGVYTYSDAQQQAALESKVQYAEKLENANSTITTEIVPAGAFYYAESYHQQYLAKNPTGYCNMQTVARTGLPEFS